MKQCPKCNLVLKDGLALQGQEKPVGIREEYSFYANQQLVFKDCLKCPQCGYSETK